MTNVCLLMHRNKTGGLEMFNDGFCFEEDKKQNNVYTFMVGLRPRLAKLVAIWSFGARGAAVVIAGDWGSRTRRIP